MKPQASGACQRITRVSRGEPGSLVDPCLGRVGLVACGVGSDEWRPPPKGVLIFKAGRGRRPPLPSRLGPGRGGVLLLPPRSGGGEGWSRLLQLFPVRRGGHDYYYFLVAWDPSLDPSLRPSWHRILPSGPCGTGSFFKALVAQGPSLRPS